MIAFSLGILLNYEKNLEWSTFPWTYFLLCLLNIKGKSAGIKGL